MRRLLLKYIELLETYPMTTKSVTSSLIALSGDALTQYIEHRGHQQEQERAIATKKVVALKHHPSAFKMDWQRGVRMMTFGFSLGPILHNWYKLLQVTSNQIQRRYHIKSPVATTALQVFIDQSAFAPVSIVYFYSFMGFIHGSNFEEIREKIRDNFWNTLMMNYTMWPFIQFVNFMFVPLMYRVLVVNMAAIAWNAFLSHSQHKEK